MGGSQHGFLFQLKEGEKRGCLKCSLLVRAAFAGVWQCGARENEAPSPGLGSYGVAWCRLQSRSSSRGQAGLDKKLRMMALEAEGWWRPACDSSSGSLWNGNHIPKPTYALEFLGGCRERRLVPNNDWFLEFPSTMASRTQR